MNEPVIPERKVFIPKDDLGYPIAGWEALLDRANEAEAKVAQQAARVAELTAENPEDCARCKHGGKEHDDEFGNCSLCGCSEYATCEEICAEQAATIVDLIGAANGLISRLEEIDAHPSYKSLLGIAFAHGVNYTGPSWSEPLEQLRAALNKQVHP